MDDESTRRAYGHTHMNGYGPTTYGLQVRNDMQRPCILLAAEGHSRIRILIPRATGIAYM